MSPTVHVSFSPPPVAFDTLETGSKVNGSTVRCTISVCGNASVPLPPGTVSVTISPGVKGLIAALPAGA